MRTTILLLATVLFFTSANGQYYNSGQEPTRTKWKLINRDEYRILFNSEVDSLATVFDKYLYHSLKTVGADHNHTPRKFSALMHSNSILSNGFVSWAPKRMEIVSTPSLDASPEPWLYHLAMHEARHIVQLDKMHGSPWRFGNILFGQQAIGFKLLMTPMWFLEGDAVYAETAHTKGGRGRQASFYRHYLAHFTSNNGSKYSYDKWLLGSYKDYIPSHYNFGYQMVGYTNLIYGPEVWSKALKGISSKFFLLSPFSQSVKKSTGYTEKELFGQVISYHNSLWKKIEPADKISTNEALIFNSYKNKDFVEYAYPFLLNDTCLIALKKTLSQRPKIVMASLTDKKEQKLYTPGVIIGRISYSNNNVFWSQYRQHPRWDYVNYSEIWRYNITDKKAERITKKTRYFNPIAYTNDNIAAIEITAKGEHYIAIIDPKGNAIEKRRAPATTELKELCKGENENLFARLASPNGMVILKYNSLNNQPDTLLGPIQSDIANLTYKNDTLYFTQTHNYRETVFSINTLTSNTYKVTNSTYGLSHLNYNKKLVASEFSSTGIYPVALSENTSKPYNLANKVNHLFYNPKEWRKFDTLTIEKPLDKNPKKYSKTKGLLNIHSWAPVYLNPFDLTNGSITIYPGFTIMSQNLTSTLTASAGYSYNKTHGAHANIEWSGIYPKIMAGFTYGNEYALVQHGPLAPNFIRYSNRPNVQAILRVRIPYVFSSGNIASGGNLGINFTYNNSWMWNYANETYQQWATAAEPYLSVYAITRKAHRDIRPKYGVQAYASYRNSPYSKLLGSKLLAKIWAYLPGFAANHSVLLSAQAEMQNPKQYVGTLSYTPTRGFDKSFAQKVKSISLDYTFPLSYPDLAFGPIIYIKRLLTNIFTDYANIHSYYQAEEGLIIKPVNQHSIGFDLTADFHVLRTTYPLRAGYRGGYRVNEKDYFHGFIFSISLDNLTGYKPNTDVGKINF